MQRRTPKPPPSPAAAAASPNAFDPHSRSVKAWQLVLFCGLLYEAFLIPYALAFTSLGVPDESLASVPAFQLFYAVELLFCADFYVQLNTGFFQDGSVHRDARNARLNYIKTLGFVLDVLAVVPFSLVLPLRLWPGGPTHPAWLEAHKLLRAQRLRRLFSTLEDVFSKHFVAMKLFKTAVVTAFTAHCVACVHHAFECAEQAGTEADALSPTQYVSSLFWSVGLLTGVFEGRLPPCSLEIVFMLSVAVVGFALFTYLCAVLFVLSKSESSQATLAEARISQLKHLLSFHQVPEALQAHVVEFVQHHNTDAESNDREVVKLLCPSIAKDIQVELLQGMMARIPLFRDCNERFIVALTSLLEMISLPAHHTLFDVGDAGDCMYIVNSGVLHILVGGTKVRELQQGSWFGEVSVFAKRPRTATVVTMSYCTLYRLSRFDTERVLEGYPHYAALIAQAVDEIVNQRQAPAAGGGIGDEKPPDDETMLTTLYQLSREQPGRHKLKKNRSLTDQLAFRPKKRTLGRSKSSLNMSAARHAEFSVGAAASVTEKGELNTTPIVLPTVPPRKRPQLARSKSAFPRQLSTTIAALTKRARPVRGGGTSPQDAIQGFYDKLSSRLLQEEREGSAPTGLWGKVLMKKAVAPASTLRQLWLVALQAHQVFNWVYIPLLLAFPLADRSVALRVVLHGAGDLVLLADLYLSCHIPYVGASHEKVTHPPRIARRYVRSAAFVADVLCLLPYEAVLLWASVGHAALLRIPRLLRVWRVFGHAREWELSFRLGSRARFATVATVFLVFVHLVTCLHFGLTHVEGFSPIATAGWMPTDDLDVRAVVSAAGDVVFQSASTDASYSSAQLGDVLCTQYSRSLFLATAMLTTRGKIAEPTSDRQYKAALAILLGGLAWTALFLDAVQKRFAASALEQKEFLVTRARIQNFLRCQSAPLEMHHRVNAFLDFWWSSHRGAIVGELLGELPATLKRQVLRSVCKPALQTLALMNDVRPALDALEQVFVDNIKIILYGQGETIYRQGDYASGLFFLLEGEVVVISNGGAPRTVPKGGFVGTAALHLNESSVSYAERLTATSGCILLFVGRAHLDAMHKTFPGLAMALKALEKRIADSKLAKAQEIAPTNRSGSPGALKDSLETRILKRLGIDEVVFDPDDTSTAAWEVLMFVLMTVQSFKVIYDASFGVLPARVAGSDAALVLLELFFCLDLFVQSRLGYYQYGNKVMELKAIKKRNRQSHRSLVELAAILPLFALNWVLPHVAARSELLNVNKLLRLARAPRTFASLENQYLKRILALRIAKLVFVAFLLSHLFGCVWFNFGVAAGDGADASGWLPDPRLATASASLQYSAAVFWSLGLMTASYSIDPPKVAAQCIFTVVVLLCGFILFAFTVGNLTDVVELADADAREFNAKMSSLRHMLAHFQLPPALQDKLKTYFFFQRFHTITHEHALERCLPPSLVTDIRLVHLRPMIAKVAFLSGMEGPVTRMLVSQFSQVLVVKNQYVCRYGEEGSDMFFVFTGILDVLVPSDTLRRKLSTETAARAPPGAGTAPSATASTRTAASGKGAPADADPATFHTYFSAADTMKPLVMAQMRKVNVLTSGSYFGEVAMFMSKPRSAHTRSRTSCVLYKLSRGSLELVFERYPDWKAKVLQIVNIQQKQQHLRNLYMEEQEDAFALASKDLTQIDLLDAAQLPGPERRATLTDRITGGSKKMVQGVSSRGSSSSSATGTHPNRDGSGTTWLPRSNSMAELRLGKQASPLWIDTLLQCTEAQSAFHVFWLKVVAVSTVFMALAVPYRISFDPLTRFGAFPVVVRVAEHSCELLFAWDIWLNWNMREGAASMELYEQHHRQSYKKERLFWDALAAFPIDHFLADFFRSPWLRINRCLKLVNFAHYMQEINRRSVSYERNRICTLWTLYFVFTHWCACTHFFVGKVSATGSADEQDGWNNWSAPARFLAPASASSTLEWSLLRFFRSAFFAATAFTKRGKTFTPGDEVEFVFSTSVAFLGLMLMALMISESANLYTSYISNEVEFRKNHIAINLYLERWHVSNRLKRRARALLASLWSAHRGVNYQALLDEVPLKIRVEATEFIANAPLERFLTVVFRPFATMHPHDHELEQLMHAISHELKYEGYPRDENVVTEGSVCKTMYFVVKGHLVSRSVSNYVSGLQSDVERLTNGHYFGEQGLLGYSVSRCTVKTMSACDLLSLSSEGLLQAILSRPLFKNALSIAVEAYREICKRERVGDTPQPPEDEWGNLICSILDKRKQMWLDDSLAMQEDDTPVAGEEMWKTNGCQAGQEVGLMMAHKPSDCVRVFEAMVQLIVARGAMSRCDKSLYSTTSHFQDNLPLMTAISFGMLDDTKGSKWRIPTTVAPTAVMATAAGDAGPEGCEDVVAELLARYSNMDAVTSLTLLCMAAMLGRERAVDKLLKRGADVDAATTRGATPLHVAAA
ncbi:hypothetical protein PybrP1_003200 [[Pythium] brassicae (nom. inval.)]|nr:hypothetical protein PybrP1_003200 [[Pythium] brassicae (nom. inval.)]